MIGTLVAVGAGAGAGTLLWGAYDPTSPVFGRAIGRGPRDRRSVYLTFDDGPRPGATEPILDTLAREGVPAAFFLVGEAARHHPGLARRVAAAGHEVGNHTRHHRKLHRLGPSAVREELTGGHRDIVEVTGQTPRVFRAPHGYRNPFVTSAARRLHYRVFGWTFGVWDSDRPAPEEIRRRVRVKLRPGAIVLLHDGDGYDPAATDARGDRGGTAAALPGIIADARSAGYDFRPLADLFA
jgi:peptidoglycan/xylan/chitin deacetylase (PgdA/CDA1 family)